MKIFILGYGEIGRAVKGLYSCYKDVYNIYYKDVNKDVYDIKGSIYLKDVKAVNSCDILHVCIPYSNSFIEAVKDVAIAINPELIMIHSTLPVMTTRILQDNLDFKIVHTPVMGKHPNLTDSIETFDKIVASYSDEANELACQHLADLGVETVIYNNPEESEMAKLLDTTYYGWNILYMKEVKKLCDKYNLDFDNVYTQTNEIYNSGYECMGNFNVIRPVLQFVPGKIGGHCVRPNFELLKDIFKPARIGIEMDDENGTISH